jgi:hypothetical protein
LGGRGSDTFTNYVNLTLSWVDVLPPQSQADKVSKLCKHAFQLTPHTSHLAPHTSHLTPHTSHLTLCHF